MMKKQQQQWAGIQTDRQTNGRTIIVCYTTVVF